MLVARNGAGYLPRTIAALTAQIRRPDTVLTVDIGSSDTSKALLADASAPVAAPARTSFGTAVAIALQSAPPAEGTDDWLWLLAHDNAPAPNALSALLGAVEVAPSVAVAGPKLMRWDEPDVIAEFGDTVTRLGRAVPLVRDELDQAQHDIHSDVLAVAAGGMLVRRSVWVALGGFDPGLPSADAALDFCVRARLAGHRVAGVPAARVASAGPPELFGRRSLSAGAQNRVHRAAQLHRRLTWSVPAALPLHWLSLVPLAFARSVAHLVAKRPGWIGGEFAAALGAAFDTGVGRARRTLRRNRAMGWAAIAPLRMPWSEVRESRATDRSTVAAAPRESVGFFAGGGGWVVVLAAVIGMVAFGRFLSADAITGGGLLPLSADVAQLWSNLGYGWRDVGAGFTGAADPFAYLLAVLGSVTFWSPSLSIVLVYLLALPLAALTAWWCASRFATRAWGPALAALGWALAPPFLLALQEGRLGAVLAHLLLPVVVAATVVAARSWVASAAAAVSFAAVTAAAPSLMPALLVGLVAWIAARPASVLRLIGIPIPAIALFAPLAIEQFQRGTPLALLADPGVALSGSQMSAWQLVLGGGLAGWPAPLVVGLLLAPLALLAILAPFLPGGSRGIPALALALLGFVTAVIATHLEVTVVGSTTASIWAGSALSLYWLGLLGAAAATLDALGRVASIPALVAVLALAVLAAPAVASSARGELAVGPGNGRLLPAFAAAEAANRPGLGTLELTAQADGGVAATVHRGEGTTLDERSTLESTRTRMDAADSRLATLAGNLVSRSGFDVAAELDELQLAFVLLGDSPEPVTQRATEALDGNRLLTPIGSTATGTLWYYEGLAPGQAPSGPGPLQSPYGIGVLATQATVFLITLLVAVPGRQGRRIRSARVTEEVAA